MADDEVGGGGNMEEIRVGFFFNSSLVLSFQQTVITVMAVGYGNFSMNPNEM